MNLFDYAAEAFPAVLLIAVAGLAAVYGDKLTEIPWKKMVLWLVRDDPRFKTWRQPK